MVPDGQQRARDLDVFNKAGSQTEVVCISKRFVDGALKRCNQHTTIHGRVSKRLNQLWPSIELLVYQKAMMMFIKYLHIDSNNGRCCFLFFWVVCTKLALVEESGRDDEKPRGQVERHLESSSPLPLSSMVTTIFV